MMNFTDPHNTKKKIQVIDAVTKIFFHLMLILVFLNLVQSIVGIASGENLYLNWFLVLILSAALVIQCFAENLQEAVIYAIAFSMVSLTLRSLFIPDYSTIVSYTVSMVHNTILLWFNFYMIKEFKIPNSFYLFKSSVRTA